MLMGFVVIILALTAITMGCRVSVACCRKQTEDIEHNERVTNHASDHQEIPQVDLYFFLSDIEQQRETHFVCTLYSHVLLWFSILSFTFYSVDI